jgi:hypothetical protein
MNFKKKILVPFRKILVPFKTTKDCHSCKSLFLVWLIYSLNWDLEMDRFVGTFYISFDGVSEVSRKNKKGGCYHPR